jgi:hypothetical protein
VFVTLGVQHAMRMRHIVICGVSSSTVFFYFILETARFSGGKKNLLSMKYVSIFSKALA